MKNRGKENGFNFKFIVTFPPVQMSIFKENYPLKDESTFEQSPILTLCYKTLTIKMCCFFFKYKLKS